MNHLVVALEMARVADFVARCWSRNRAFPSSPSWRTTNGKKGVDYDFISQEVEEILEGDIWKLIMAPDVLKLLDSPRENEQKDKECKLIGKLALDFVLCHPILQNMMIFTGIKLKYSCNSLKAGVLHRTSYLIGKYRDSGRRVCPRRVDHRRSYVDHRGPLTAY